MFEKVLDEAREHSLINGIKLAKIQAGYLGLIMLATDGDHTKDVKRLLNEDPFVP